MLRTASGQTMQTAEADCMRLGTNGRRLAVGAIFSSVDSHWRLRCCLPAMRTCQVAALCLLRSYYCQYTQLSVDRISPTVLARGLLRPLTSNLTFLTGRLCVVCVLFHRSQGLPL